MKPGEHTWRSIVIEIVLILVTLLFLAPFYFVLANSVKPFGAIIRNAAAFPETFHFANYVNAWEIVNLPQVLLNSFIVTAFSIAGMIIMGSMSAWRMVRTPRRLHRILFILYVSAIVIPFQSVMLPMIQIADEIGLLNSRPGVVVIYYGFGLPLTVFLLHGFVKGIPHELEESAYVDGAGTFTTFFRIVLPMLQTMIITVVILHTMWVWNDFLLPLLVISDANLYTIPLGIFNFFGRHQDRWDTALATLTMGMSPIVLMFIFLQQYIISGVTAGSIKA